jgi:hypothetical protein
MKQYLIAISIVLVLILGMIGGCSQKPEQVHEPSSKDALTPRVIEKDVEIKHYWREREVLPFYLKVGDRVDGEVSIIDEGVFYNDRFIEQKAFVHSVGSLVKDPYGNNVVEARHSFPWRFAFIAYTDGEYELSVYFTTGVEYITPSAHLKITIYEGD